MMTPTINMFLLNKPYRFITTILLYQSILEFELIFKQSYP